LCYLGGINSFPLLFANCLDPGFNRSQCSGAGECCSPCYWPRQSQEGYNPETCQHSRWFHRQNAPKPAATGLHAETRIPAPRNHLRPSGKRACDIIAFVPVLNAFDCTNIISWFLFQSGFKHHPFCPREDPRKSTRSPSRDNSYPAATCAANRRFTSQPL
jgi:hypothetical protein